ncbi:MAG: response regulator [Thermoanaerobaculia bacterium]|nr:response regulator [Thermoanaerobaculia bacterium]
MKLLIVDDSLVVRNAIDRAVQSGDVHVGELTNVHRAENGARAVELFASERPDMVTMDLTMPELDGLGAIRRIREIEPDASILVISALNSHKTALEAIKNGACGFLTKPFTEIEVVDALKKLASHARLRTVARA